MDFLARLFRVGRLIGNTPLIQIDSEDFPHYRIRSDMKVTMKFKAEYLQFSGSVKARAAFAMVTDAIFRAAVQGKDLEDTLFPTYIEKLNYLKNLELSPEEKLRIKKNLGKGILEATSGNTGIALAAICASASIPVTLCIPENVSKERLLYLNYLGANTVLTSKLDGTDGAEERAAALSKSGDYYWTDQYKNQENLNAHYFGTALEILKDYPQVTHFVSGIGTGGTLTGNGSRLKKENKTIKVIALQPDNPMHGLEGWKHLETVSVPEIYDRNLADEIIEVSTEESYRIIKILAAKAGLLLSPSSAANIQGALKLAEKFTQEESFSEGIHIASVLPDDASRYTTLLSEL